MRIASSNRGSFSGRSSYNKDGPNNVPGYGVLSTCCSMVRAADLIVPDLTRNRTEHAERLLGRMFGDNITCQVHVGVLMGTTRGFTD